MNERLLISCRGVCKTFPHHRGRTLLRSHLLGWFSRSPDEDFYALRNISFNLSKGESLGIIGGNGAGKSTLLGLVAGLSKPNQGSIEVSGRVAALLELGSGFHPDLTGAENLILNASLLGLSRRQTLAVFDQIVEFSGVVDFIDEPLRTYSSGMIVRLAFSVAMHTEPEIMIIDEILAVGDATFQQKCFEALVDFRNRGGSLLFVSHGAGAVARMCDRALWIDHGELMMDGEVGSVLQAYEGHHTVVT